MGETAAPTATDLPSGSFVSVKADGFEIQSNTGTADDMRAELGIPTEQPAAPTEGTQAEPPKIPAKARRSNPYVRLEAATAAEAQAKRERDEAKAEADRLKAEIDALKKPAAAAPVAAQEPARQADIPVVADAGQGRGQNQPPHQGSPAPSVGEPVDPEPKLEDPKYQGLPDPYTSWLLERNAWGTRQEITKSFKAQAAYNAEVAAHYTWMERVNKTPDFHAKFKPETPIHREIVPYIKRLDYGPAVMVYLSENQAEAQRLTTLHPVEQIGQIGEIVGLLKARTAAASTNGSAPKPPPVSQATPVVKPLTGGPSAGSPEAPGDDASDEVWDAYWRQKRKGYR